MGESAEEEEDFESLNVEGADAGSNSRAVEKAITQLTKVCSAPQMKKGSQIEQLLDGTGLDRSEGSGSGARKNTTALRALRKCLAENPEYIYIPQWQPPFFRTSR